MTNVSRPMCAVCFREPRELNSARCWDCGPGRIAPLPHRPRTQIEWAALALNAEDSSV